MPLQFATAAECSQETATSLTCVAGDEIWSNPVVALALHIDTVLPLSLVVEPCLVHVHKDDIMKPSNVGQQPARPAQVDQCLESSFVQNCYTSFFQTIRMAVALRLSKSGVCKKSNKKLNFV